MFKNRIIKDAIARYIMLALAFLVSVLIFIIAYGLVVKSAPILKLRPLWELILSTNWKPSAGYFGFASFILGTIWVTVVAMILAVPASLLAAIYLAEYSHKRIRQIFKPILDVAGGISPVIFGLFGVLTVVPFVKSLSADHTGFSVLAAGIVLAIMIFPTMTSVAEEVIASVPLEARESSLALGATSWETVKYVVLKSQVPA